MSWWVWAILGWVALSVPFGVLVGRAIRTGQGGDSHRAAGGKRLPAQRDADGAVDDLSA